MNNSQIEHLLNALVMFLGIILCILVIILVVLLIKRMQITRNTTEKKKKNTVETDKSKTTATSQYNKQSVFDFMEFDKIEDNMIIQKEGFKYLMIIECQGINYDLMSGLEKVSVEKGFIQFLNTLRQPIQLYIQTRTVNLGSSISNYNDRITDIANKLNQMTAQYNQLLESKENVNVAQLQRLRFEIIKQKNLYDYGVDIVNNTEKMSLNKNILRKNYFIVVPYYAEEAAIGGKYDKEEIKGLAFSELYTNCQSMIQSLGACSIQGKILNSRELAELLYVAYNRDESEAFELEKAIRAGYSELYTTSQDVLDKKMLELDKAIIERAKVLANNVISEAIIENKKERMVKEKEANARNLADEKAKEMISESEAFLGKEIVNKSIEIIDKKATKREVKANAEKAKRRATGRKQ